MSAVATNAPVDAYHGAAGRYQRHPVTAHDRDASNTT